MNSYHSCKVHFKIYSTAFCVSNDYLGISSIAKQQTNSIVLSFKLFWNVQWFALFCFFIFLFL